MPSARVHDIELNRITSFPRVRVHDIELASAAQGVPAPKVHVTDIFLTVGFEQPQTSGAVRIRSGGTWVNHNMFVRWNGEWL